jgi:heme A synthase
VLLGIATTLLSHGHIPVALGVAHQTNALLILAAAFVLMRLEPGKKS